MNRLAGFVAVTALLTAGCASGAVSGQSRPNTISPATQAGLSTHLRAAPMVGPVLRFAAAPAAPVPQRVPTITTQRTIQGTPQPAVASAQPAATEQPGPPSQASTTQCPPQRNIGIACFVR